MDLTDEERELVAAWSRMHPSVRVQLGRPHGLKQVGMLARRTIASARRGEAHLLAQGVESWWAERMRERWKLGLEDD